MDLPTRHELLRTALAHSVELTRFFKRRASDPTDAQDLMQELYLALLKAQFPQSVQQPKAYLTIAANLVYQHRQRRGGHPPHVALQEVPAEVFESAHPGLKPNAPESAAALAQLLSELERRLSELSPKVQAVILWHHRDGYTCDEIAEKLSVVTHRVKKYLVKGLTYCRATCAVEEL